MAHTEDFKPRGWHSRGYLPHFDGGEIPQFITIRLFDSMPQKVLARWQRELEQESADNIDILLRKRIEHYLDQGYGSCYLKIPQIASLVQNALLYFDGERYRLFAWVVMPNHLHLLATPCSGFELSQIMKSIKNYTSLMSNRWLNRKGHFWMVDYFDRYTRDKRHFFNVIEYIENNPVKAGLCKKASDWKFSSVYSRSKKMQQDS